MYTIIQFSPTGNAAHIARLLGGFIGTDVVLPLEHTDPKTLGISDHLIIIYAIHAFNAPKIVKKFIENIPASIANNVSLIGVGCNTTWINQASSKDIRAILEKKGFNISVDEVIAMPLTLVTSFSDEMVYEQLEEAKKNIITIVEHIKNNTVTLNVYPFKTKLLQKVGRIEPAAAKLFGLELHAKDNCTLCGLCVRECPTKNIKMTEQGKIKFGFKCMMCMRCIYNCPEKAITPYISKFLPIKNGYSLDKYL